MAVVGCSRRMMIDGLDLADESPEGTKRSQSVALDHIYDYYKKALDRLPPELIPSLLEAGFSFGFLDPVSNIIANTVSHEQGTRNNNRSRDIAKKKGKRSKSESERLRGTAISKIIIAESSKYFYIEPGHSDDASAIRNSSIAARSLRGLVTFLTSYFRYITIWDALRYLCLSKADLLVAVHLIEEDHATYTFTINDPRTKIALRCAAISALHPGVPAFVSRSFSLASHVDEVSNLLATQDRGVGPSTMKRVRELFTFTKEMIDPRELSLNAISRMQNIKLATVPFGLEISLEVALLYKIHLLYLKAISRIPKHDLCSRYHRGLLKAGHCYGPFDPVTNIILNTIWYDAAFPATQEFEVEMIFTKSLARVEYLSLCGLVAYIRVCFPAFSKYEAMIYLLNNPKLDRVIVMAKLEDRDRKIPFSESDAYDAASRAAFHPSPTALVEFATTVMPVVGETLRSMLKVKRMLSSSDVHSISETLSRKFPPRKSLESLPELSTHASEIISANHEKFEDHQSEIVERVEAALLRYAHQGGEEYELHVICDVNDEVPEYGNFCFWSGEKRCSFSHMNILARQKGSQNADAVPTLFFIECSNNYEDMQGATFFCCAVLEPSKDAGRCFYCEYQGTKISIHLQKHTLGIARNLRIWLVEKIQSTIKTLLIPSG